LGLAPATSIIFIVYSVNAWMRLFGFSGFLSFFGLSGLFGLFGFYGLFSFSCFFCLKRTSLFRKYVMSPDIILAVLSACW